MGSYFSMGCIVSRVKIDIKRKHRFWKFSQVMMTDFSSERVDPDRGKYWRVEVPIEKSVGFVTCLKAARKFV